MSKWSELGLGEKVVDVLTSLHGGKPTHHFGRPWVTAYQLAIEMERRFPGIAERSGKPIGGAGAGQETSLSQYLANELSKQIKSDGPDHPVEGAFLGNEHVTAITYRGPNGETVTSSLTGSGFPLALFRLRGDK